MSPGVGGPAGSDILVTNAVNSCNDIQINNEIHIDDKIMMNDDQIKMNNDKAFGELKTSN